MKSVLELLPPGNRTILAKLLSLLNKIDKKSSKNKMPASNLAIVFSPNILRPKVPGDLHRILEETNLCAKIIQAMIQHFSLLFHDVILMLLTFKRMENLRLKYLLHFQSPKPNLSLKFPQKFLLQIPKIKAQL
jgi:hypothetical protein